MFGSGGLAGLSSGFGMGMAKGGFSWMNLLNGAQKTLGFVNQAIPLYNQVRPLFRNAGTMFKIVGALNDKPQNIKKNTSNTIIEQRKIKEESTITKGNNSSNRPTFFL